MYGSSLSGKLLRAIFKPHQYVIFNYVLDLLLNPSGFSTRGMAVGMLLCVIFVFIGSLGPFIHRRVSKLIWLACVAIVVVSFPLFGFRPGLRLPASTLNPVADALKKVHTEAATRTRTALAQATAAAAEQAASQPPPPVLSTSHLRELSAAASRLFGWDHGQKQGDTYNALVISAEQLARIRELRRATLQEENY